ncbi:MAG: U32 family peptidase [Lentisphaeria bacterium]|nr:U32 family peptidase [Lentisphaeria bacterium]
MTQMELLAPAGNAACALAAFDAGADAIYAGLAKFNARERSENFTPETMAGIIEYAHRHSRKVYVTVNTIVKQPELPAIAEYLAMLSEMAPDALIVQDLGVLRMIREYFPALTIHASTQMGIHNSAGMKIAEELGVKRVILERQMTFDEIRSLKEQTSLELEMFIHGALCCSLSGQCLFSSWHGGASGNRGRCKQPCRRRFYSKTGNGFFFSPQDLCLIDCMDEVRSLGVASLKIEGRLRQPDYVHNVVSAYRMMLDNTGSLGEARNLLSRTCGRKWSHGFYQPESAAHLIQHENIGAAGLLCGQVSELRDNGFAFITTKRLHVGDRLRVQPRSGEEGPALTVTKMFVNNRSSMIARTGDQVFVCCDKPTSFGGMVFKIGESFDDCANRIAALPKPRKKLDLAIRATQKSLTVSVKNAPFPDWTESWELAPAEKHALQPETLQEAFALADSPVFTAPGAEISIDGNYFCPAQILKAVRRKFRAQLEETLSPDAVFSDAAVGLEKFRRALQSIVPAEMPENMPETIAIRPNGEMPANRNAIRANGIFEVNKLTGEAILPEFCPESVLPALRRAIADAYQRKIRRFRTPSLYGLELLREYPDLRITAGGALPVANAMAVEELRRFGVTKVLAHIELEKSAVQALAKSSPLTVELFRFGRPVLLITRAAFPVDGDFRESSGNVF